MSQWHPRGLVALRLAALALVSPVAPGDVPIDEVELGAVRSAKPPLTVDVLTPLEGLSEARLIVICGPEPLGWFMPARAGSLGQTFVSRGDVEVHAGLQPWRGWVVGPALLAAAFEHWPVEAELRAEIDAVSPGAASVWIDAGMNHGVAFGDCWWRRVNGQPVARYDVRLVGKNVCFCRVVPLATGSFPARGDLVSLWPTPGQRRTGSATTAVSFVGTDGDDQIVWVPAPPRVVTPAESHLEFSRDGRYVGSGIAERRDQRFWYVRILVAAGVDAVRVGDDAIVRTLADIRQRRFSARVFERTTAGYLIDAGRIDGLLENDVGTAYRDGRPIAEIVLADVRRGYSVVKLVAGGAQNPTTQSSPGQDRLPGGEVPALRLLDEVRFRPPRSSPSRLAALERVVDRTLFSARVASDTHPPLYTPLALRRAGRVIGVAILLDVTERHALGFAPARSLTVTPATGDELALDGDGSAPADLEARDPRELHPPTRR